MAFNPNQQTKLISGLLSPKDLFTQSMARPAPWDNITDFMTHPSFCGRRLYPRQRTLYKLIFLEEENFTDYDWQVIHEWREGFVKRRDTFGVQPDIIERMRYLKENGYRRFPHVQLIIGRRGSKGLTGGGLGCEQLAYFYSLDDWQKHYETDRNQNGVLSVVATSQGQAQRYQFADIRRTVERCKYLQPHIATNKDHFLSIRTPADLRHIAELKAAKVTVGHEIASLTAIALSASSSAGRGGVGFANFYDEMAHMVMGTGSVKSGDEIYNAWQPSLDQFAKDGLTVTNSSPFCLGPSTRVLTEDLLWVPVGSVQVGDRLIGFDEYSPHKTLGGKERGRTWQPAVVTETSTIQAPRYEMTMESGKVITCTGEHMWLTSWGSQKSRWDWRKTSEMKPGDRIKTLGVDPWESEDSREAGYLAGFFDGEGHLSAKNSGGRGLCSLGYSQNYGPTQAYVERLIKEREFDLRNYDDRYGRMARARIYGGTGEMLRFLGTIRPERLLANFPAKFYGGRIYNYLTKAVDHVVSVRRVDDGPVVALGTSTNTLVAEGLLSHNTKIGIFFKLYTDGKVLMPNYKGELREETEKSLGVDAEEEIDILTADPEMIILQLPSWGLYEDWQRGPELIGRVIKRPITYSPDGDQPENIRMARLERKNPTKFRVERRAQFAEVEGAYLDPLAVEAMFKNPGWRPPLVAQDRGYLVHKYRIHCDPSRTGANFAIAVGHNEIAPCDNCGAMPDHSESFHPCKYCVANKQPGMHWPHVIFDLLHVWKPGDAEPDEDGRRQINPIKVMSGIRSILQRFPSTTRITFDQYDSALGMAQLRQEFSPGITVAEVLFTEKDNQRRAERFKSALNLKWMHAYNDQLFGEGGSLLEMEMKFLAERNGKVIKQDFGPVTTKDLFDAVCVVATDLLKDALDKHKGHSLSHPSFGSSDAAGLKGGRELQRLGSAGVAVAERLANFAGDNPAREKLSALHDGHPRRSQQLSRTQSIRARGMPRAGGSGGRRFR